jgi:hypothetical protein
MDVSDALAEAPLRPLKHSIERVEAQRVLIQMKWPYRQCDVRSCDLN